MRLENPKSVPSLFAKLRIICLLAELSPNSDVLAWLSVRVLLFDSSLVRYLMDCSQSSAGRGLEESTSQAVFAGRSIRKRAVCVLGVLSQIHLRQTSQFDPIAISSALHLTRSRRMPFLAVRLTPIQPLILKWAPHESYCSSQALTTWLCRRPQS